MKHRIHAVGVVAVLGVALLGGCDPGGEGSGEDPLAEPHADVTPALSVSKIPRGASWRAWDRGGDLGTAWAARGFDDSTWRSGAGPLGYGETYLATTLGYGPSATSKYVTTYFRHTFTVDDPSAVTALTGEVMYDDGIVVYLNGTRIGRDSMPSGTYNASTLALGHEANNAYQRYDWTAQKSLLVAGTNVIAVEVHQASRDSSDLVFDLSLALETAGSLTPLPEYVGGLPRGTSWKYWDKGGDLGTAWRSGSYDHPGFDDNAWPYAPGPLGYGETYQKTTIGYGANPAAKYTTSYFRAQFFVIDPEQAQSMIGELMYDDGCVVYLNGTEIMRRSMPAGTITASTLALEHEAQNHYEAFDWSGHRGLLTYGWNVIAVEVHQASPSSSDLMFDLSFTMSSVGPSPPADAPEDIAPRSTWRFYDRGVEPGRYGYWHEDYTYSDAGWSSGVGPFGYGESYVATPVSYGPDPANKYITTYFRKWINVPHPSAHTRLTGDVMYDDGVVVYLNGHEIDRLHMPDAWSVTYSTLSTGHETGNAYERRDWSASNRYLVAGYNLVAVEVHQASASSSDMTFDLALDVETPAVPGIPGCGAAYAPLPSQPLLDVWVGPEAVWAVGPRGSIGRRALAGDDTSWHWCLREGGVDLTSVHGTAEDDIWFVGAAGTVLHYDGASFTPVDVGTSALLSAVWSNGPADVWIVGDVGTVRHLDGGGWHAVDLGPEEILQGVWAGSAEDVWISGRDRAPYPGNSNYDGWNAFVYRWVPASGTWNREANYTMYYGYADFPGLRGGGGGDLWAVGEYVPAGAAASYSQAVHRAADGTWTTADLSDELIGNHVYNDVLPLGSEVWIASGGSMVHFDGSAWNEEPAEASSMVGIDGRPGEIWAVGYANHVIRRLDTGWVRDW
jgi:hypothetical protein